MRSHGMLGYPIFVHTPIFVDHQRRQMGRVGSRREPLPATWTVCSPPRNWGIELNLPISYWKWFRPTFGNCETHPNHGTKKVFGYGLKTSGCWKSNLHVGQSFGKMGRCFLGHCGRWSKQQRRSLDGWDGGNSLTFPFWETWSVSPAKNRNLDILEQSEYGIDMNWFTFSIFFHIYRWMVPSCASWWIPVFALLPECRQNICVYTRSCGSAWKSGIPSRIWWSKMIE